MSESGEQRWVLNSGGERIQSRSSMTGEGGHSVVRSNGMASLQNCLTCSDSAVCAKICESLNLYESLLHYMATDMLISGRGTDWYSDTYCCAQRDPAGTRTVR